MGNKKREKQHEEFHRQEAKPLVQLNVLIIVLALIGAVFIGWFVARPETKPQTPLAKALAPKVPALPIKPILEPEKTAHAGYAGSATCRGCHAELFEQWSKSNHGLAERPLREDLDKVAFEPLRSFQHGTQTSEARIQDGKHEVVTLGFDNKREPYKVQRVIGNDPLRQYLVEAFGGRLQTLEVAHDPHKNEWFNVYGSEDRKPGEWGHWTGRGMTWNTMCASCHNTRLRKNYDEKTDTFRTTMAEMTVSCESCHGPMKAHLDWRKQYPDKTIADPTIKKPTPMQTLDTCASCHSRRTELTGDFKPGDNYFDHHALAITDETTLYHPDGQVRDEDYELASFLSSKMHVAGVKCLDCHNPHTAKTILAGNALCMRCHTAPTPQFPKAPIINLAAHTFHQAESTGSQCINCHMPQTTFMQRHQRHDHAFTIPDPLLTKQLNIPNACNRCHTDKDTEWSLAAVDKWYGEKMNRPTRQRAQTVAAARNGDPTAREALLKIVQGAPEKAVAPPQVPEPVNTQWQASAVRLLDPWMSDANVNDTVMKQAANPDPQVRANVARAMEPLMAQNNAKARGVADTLLNDSMRSVRLAAAWALRGVLDLETQQGRELLHMLDHNADQPSGQLQYGAFWFARNKPQAALNHYQKAVEWDPNSAPFRHELAVAYSVVGKQKEALHELQEAVRLDPTQSEFTFKLALAWNETGDADQTIKALEQTVKIDPRHARAWYNLGIARNGKGDTAGAIDALKRGELANPNDAGIPYARATIHARLGQKEEARDAAVRAVQIQPDNQEAIQLLYSLQPKKP